MFVEKCTVLFSTSSGFHIWYCWYATSQKHKSPHWNNWSLNVWCKCIFKTKIQFVLTFCLYILCTDRYLFCLTLSIFYEALKDGILIFETLERVSVSLLMLSAKQGYHWYHFKHLWYDMASIRDWTLDHRTQSKHYTTRLSRWFCIQLKNANWSKCSR